MVSFVKNKVVTIVLSVALLVWFGLLLTACNAPNSTTHSISVTQGSQVQQNASGKHKITFMDMEGASGKVLGEIYTNGNELIELPQIPVKLGYQVDENIYFYPLITKDENGDVISFEYSYIFPNTFESKPLEQDLVVYANYTAKKYKITYFVDGSLVEVAQADQRVLDGQENPSTNCIEYYVSENDLALPTPEVAGKTFVGWFLNPRGGYSISCLKAGTTGDLTLYALFD